MVVYILGKNEFRMNFYVMDFLGFVSCFSLEEDKIEFTFESGVR